MNEEYTQSCELPSELNLEGLSEQEARAIKEALGRFMKSYQEKPEEQGDEAWLTQRFQEELPNLTAEQAQTLSRETLEEIHQYDENLASLKEARSKGQTTEEWFAEKSSEAASGLSANAFGQRVTELDTALSQANAQMARIVTTQSGAVNQQWNLDGFLAEQHHVNSFNLAAQTNSRNGHSSQRLRTSFGEVDVSVPRDRKGEFEPQVLKKNQTSISQDIEEKILSMYAKGMTTGDIETHIQDIYGISVSDSTVSRITDKVLPVAKEWQQRPLEPIYAVVFLDAIHYHIRSEGQIVKKAVYIAIGVNLWCRGHFHCLHRQSGGV